MLNGAQYHTEEEIREFLHKMQLRVIWSAPYSFSTAPIEKCFAGLKQKELNQRNQPLGKKVSALVFLLMI